MQTLDSTIVFKKTIFGGLKSMMSSGNKPTPFIPESIKLTSMFADQIDGKATSFIGEALLGTPSTAHILGGAVMGKDAKTGVIDENNKVFGYKNMYVIDGSMISANPGVNPALSITAIAERAMSKIESKGLSNNI
jgi:cholesterol oxidase